MKRFDLLFRATTQPECWPPVRLSSSGYLHATPPGEKTLWLSGERYDQIEIIASFEDIKKTLKSVYEGYYYNYELMVETTDLLPHLLQKMVEDIKDPECHYWLYSSYFDIQPPTDRTIIRWHHTPLYLDYDALWNPEFVDDGMLFDVILKNQLPAEKERLKLEYAQINLIKRSNLGELS